MTDMSTLPANIYIPLYALAALDALEQAGHEAWFVGGCVRDALMGRPVNDYDIATSATWEQTEQAVLAAGLTAHRTGVKHGTLTAVADGQAIEITTYRADGEYSDGRHPDQVKFVTSIEEDLARRDFTVNALAYHPERGILDCWGGLRDLEDRTIRTVGDAEQRFFEDGLRVLRGCRFASQLGFSIDETTLAAMKKSKTMLFRVANERIVAELDKMLMGDFVHDALMDTIDVLVIIMPELAACKGFEQHTPYHIYDVWEHIAWVVQHAPKTRIARWAALLHDIGKPGAFYMENGRGHFLGHPMLSVTLGGQILDRLGMSSAFKDKVLKVVRLHDYQIAATTRSVKRALNWLDGDVELFRTLCDIKVADALSQSDLSEKRLTLARELPAVLDEVIASQDAFTVAQLAVNGHDVMALGIPAGPEVGALLSRALEEVIDDRLPNEREALLAFLKANA